MSIILLLLLLLADEGYINMAPSGATAKPNRNGRNGDCELYMPL